MVHVPNEKKMNIASSLLHTVYSDSAVLLTRIDEAANNAFLLPSYI